MSAAPNAAPPPSSGGGLLARAPVWLLGLVPIALIALVLGTLALLGGPGLGERRGPPVEELAVERTVLRPGEIELTVRNAGPDPVDVAQVFVNDAYVDFDASSQRAGKLGALTLTLDYPWQEGSPYNVTLLTSAGGTIEHEIDVAVATPSAGPRFYGVMALLGTYVGVVPVVLGMLFLPFLRRVRQQWVRIFLAVTIGLLGFLALDGYLEALEFAGQGSGAFGGAELVILGAALAYFVLMAIDRLMRARSEREKATGASPLRLATMVAVGIGLHNLGEGLAIGSAYALGAVALGAFLVIGFALHNTTEGLAIVAPLASRPPGLGRLALLGLIAGAPAILGAFIGAAAFNPSVAALLLGVGVGAIIQVIQQIAPTIRDGSGRILHAHSIAGILAGVGILYLTGLLLAV